MHVLFNEDNIKIYDFSGNMETNQKISCNKKNFGFLGIYQHYKLRLCQWEMLT